MSVMTEAGDLEAVLEESKAWDFVDNSKIFLLGGSQGGLAINISMYGGFEQVVVFYGSNSWAYTRLGRITDKTEQELAEILGNEDVVLRFDIK